MHGGENSAVNSEKLIATGVAPRSRAGWHFFKKARKLKEEDDEDSECDLMDEILEVDDSIERDKKRRTDAEEKLKTLASQRNKQSSQNLSRDMS